MHAHTYALVLLFFVGEIPKRGLVGPNNIHIFILGDIAILVFFFKVAVLHYPTSNNDSAFSHISTNIGCYCSC